MALLTTQQIKPTTTAVNQQKPVAQVAPLPKAATKVGNIPVAPMTTTSANAGIWPGYRGDAPPVTPGAQEQPKPIAATTREVGNNELVENRLNNLISGNSEYIKLAEAKAKEQAAGRGLLNSSLAAGAGRGAAISAALPIAQQDASTYANQALTNQQATNQFNLQDKQYEQQKALSSQAFGYDMAKQTQQQGWQSGETAKDREWQAEQAKVQAEQQAALTEKRDKLLASLQTQSQKDTLSVEVQRMQAEFDFRAKESALNMSQQNRMAFAEAQNRLMNQYLESMQSIYQNSSMKPDQQEAAVAKMRSEVQAQLDLTSLLFADFSGIGGTTTPTGPITKPNPGAIIPKPDIGQLTGGNTKPGGLPTLEDLVGKQPGSSGGSTTAPKTNAAAGWKISRSNPSGAWVTGPNGETKHFASRPDAERFLGKAPDTAK